MKNPLLEIKKFPDFSKIRAKHITPAIQKTLAENSVKVQKLLSKKELFTWNNLMQPLEDLHDRLHTIWSIVEHLNSVRNSPQLREAYNENLQHVTRYFTELAQNSDLYNAIVSIKKGKDYKKLNVAQKKIIDNELRDFRLSGIALLAQKRRQFAKNLLKLSQLSSKFSDNVLDATQGWVKVIREKKELSGVPEYVLKSARSTARQRKVKGWVLTLDQPIYIAAMTYADSRKLREEMYTAYVTRASDRGPNAKKWDNSAIMRDIIKCRFKLSFLLEYSDYAEYSLATKMVNKPQTVLDFLYKLAKRSKKKAESECEELRQFAQDNYNIKKLQPWDITYISEKLRQRRYNISQEELRPYFSEQQVLAGMYKLVNKLYGISIKPAKNIAVWHKDVKVFAVYSNKKLLSYFYLDLYARADKRGGAWMSDGEPRRRSADGKIQLPIAYITCNFNGPVGKDPSLFTHAEVITLFHEFGHALQHMLTEVDYSSVSGINGIPWDAVELASQFMEYWCWQKPVIKLIGKHYETGKSLPAKLFDRLVQAKNFQSGLQMLRQLEFALFDFRLHMECFSGQKKQVQDILDEVRANISVFPQVKFNRFQHGFLHIFAGGYAAGYYSYKWAEVLAADVFAKFEEEGLFNKKLGKSFRQTFLAEGGVIDPMVLFKKFRGRSPKISPLLAHDGIIDGTSSK